MKSRDIVTDIESEKVSILIGVPLLFENIASAFRKRLQAASGGRRILASMARGVASFLNRLFG